MFKKQWEGNKVLKMAGGKTISFVEEYIPLPKVWKYFKDGKKFIKGRGVYFSFILTETGWNSISWIMEAYFQGKTTLKYMYFFPLN